MAVGIARVVWLVVGVGSVDRETGTWLASATASAMRSRRALVRIRLRAGLADLVRRYVADTTGPFAMTGCTSTFWSSSFWWSRWCAAHRRCRFDKLEGFWRCWCGCGSVSESSLSCLFVPPSFAIFVPFLSTLSLRHLHRSCLCWFVVYFLRVPLLTSFSRFAGFSGDDGAGIQTPSQRRRGEGGVVAPCQTW